MTELYPALDRSALRVNQGSIVALLVLAFVGAWSWLVAGVAVVMAIGAATGRPGFALVYPRFLRPVGWVKPERAAEGAARLPRLRDGVPAVPCFFSPGCTSCRTVQAPALERLRERWSGGLQVVAIDALAEPALADRWGALTVPTTIVLDARGIARRAHFGVASAERLAASLREAIARHGP